MADLPRRHPNVVNVSEVEPQERVVGTHFAARYSRIAASAGSSALGCMWFEVPPGRTAMPLHYHCANEEAVYVLEGTGTLRLGAETIALRAGDWVAFPVGPEHAHQIINTGEVPLRYLGLSTRLPTDVVGYPDSKKILAWAAVPGAPPDDPPWHRHMTEEESAVDYFHREKVD